MRKSRIRAYPCRTGEKKARCNRAFLLCKGGKTMKKVLRAIVFAVLAGVFLISSGRVLRQQRNDRQAADSYREALELAVSGSAQALPAPDPGAAVWVPAPVEADAHMQTLAAMDLGALQQRNGDVLGWILIPDTQVNYPFLQGEDNEFYLYHTWQKEENPAGSIFMECQNSPDMTDFNTILYGHNMNSGAMFHTVREFTDQRFWEAHPYIYLLTGQGVWRYEIFSCYKAPVDSFTYGLNIRQDKTKAYLIENALRESRIETGVEPSVTDRILTLSTCAGGGYTERWVVHARLKMVEQTR